MLLLLLLLLLTIITVAGTYNVADGAFHSKALEDINPLTHTDITGNVRASLETHVPDIGFLTKKLCPAGIALDLNQGECRVLALRA
jgi:hypothetical protein